MKYICYLLVTVLLTGNNLSAQIYTAIKAGGGFATLKPKYENNFPGRVVWYGGLLVHIETQSQFFFQPELLYSLRGYRLNAGAFGNTYSTNISYGYLSMPLLAGYKPAKNVSILVGPEPGYLLSAKSHPDNNTSVYARNVNNRFSVDATAGAALSITPELAIEARVVIGMTGLYRVTYVDNNGSQIETTNTGRNRVLQVGITYRVN